MKSVIASLLPCLICLSAAAGEVKFTKKPTARRAGGKVRIEFAVNGKTDVAVYVLDAKGKAVRHLVAGVLGTNPPKPLRPGLSQSLEWDGKDDKGKPASGGPFKVRVKAGTEPAFDSFMLFNPDATPGISSLAVGPKGNIYAFYQDITANGNQGGVKLKLLARDGSHLKMLLPFPADIPYQRVKATGAFQDADGSLVPHCHNWHSLSFYPDTIRTRGRSMTGMGCPIVDKNGRVYWLIKGGRLCALDPDGGVPYKDFLGPPLFPELKYVFGRPALAISSDGKYIYAGGITVGAYIIQTKPVACVYRINLATRKCEKFLGDPAKPGTTGSSFTDPRGVAVAKGLLYIADPKANRVAVFKESDRKLVGEIKVTAPHIVQVHPKTGAVYVCAYVPTAKPTKYPRNVHANLLKFNSYKDAKPAYQLALPRTGLSPNYGTHRIALDASANPPLIWAPGVPWGPWGRRIGCYRDTGKGFVRVSLKPIKGPWAQGPRDLLVDRKRGDFYVKINGEKYFQFDEETGKLKRSFKFAFTGYGTNLCVDPKGDYVVHSWGANRGMIRWKRDLKPLNWEGQKTNYTKWGGMMTFQLNYLAMRGNDIYLIKPQLPLNLEIFDLGLKKKRTAVWNVRRGSVPRVDAKGNIYVTVPLRPPDRDFQKFFDGKLKKIPDYFRGLGDGHYWYTYMAGAIVKFPPEGGAFNWIGDGRAKNGFTGLPAPVAAKPKRKARYFLGGRYPHKIAEVQGAEWMRFDYAPYSETYPAGTPVCMCEGAGFDVDPFGRVFYTNLFRFRVEMIDTNNNFIGSFGKYGNQDSLGAGKSIPRPTEGSASAAGAKHPDVPLAWPAYVAVSDDYAYVNDTVNLRVVRVKLGCQAQETCAVQ